EQQVQTRERLVDAAARVFARRGYHAATLAEVAREAGNSTGAVYSNFSGKEDLFLALADRQVAGRAEQAQAIADLAPEDPWADGRRLERAIASWFRSFTEENEEWPLLFYEFWSYGVRNAELRSEFEARRAAARKAIAAPLAQVAAERGLKLRYPAEELAAALSGVINGLAFERTVNPDAMSERVAAFVVSTLLRESFEQPAK
ncbi:MAG: TetR/AcrR family transcriptional regulator, partial [Candidatus Limnocylindria bacterium]